MTKQALFKNLPKNRMFICKKSGFIWVSNPKVASSSMRYYIITNEFKNINDYSKNEKIKTHGKNSIISKISANKFSESELREIFTTTPKICFARNPYDRFISTYMNKISKQIGNEHLWHEKPKRQILEALEKNPKDINQHVNVDEFIIALKKINIKNLNKHFAPQIYSVRPDIINYDFIIHLENLDSEIAELNKSLGLTISLDKRLKVTKSKKIELSSNHIEFITRFFDEDFKAFGYKTADLVNKE